MTSSRANESAPRSKRTSVRDLAAAVGLTALDVVDALRARRNQAYNQVNPPVTCSITIDRSPEDVYARYRKFSQLPVFMDFLHVVREADRQWSHWVARLPSGTVAWDVKITDDIPGELLAWRSVQESKIQLRAVVTFTRTPTNGTEVQVEMQLGFAGTLPNAELANCFSEAQIRSDLARLKDVLEEETATASEPVLAQTAQALKPAPVAKEVWQFERPLLRTAAL